MQGKHGETAVTTEHTENRRGHGEEQEQKFCSFDSQFGISSGFVLA
jgi:hypothetical protein